MKKIRTKKDLIISLLILFILINSLGLLAGGVIYSKLYCSRSPERDIFTVALDDNILDIEWYEKLNKEEISIVSTYGYNLYGIYIENPKQTQDTVILVHGMGQDKWTMVSAIELYLNKGFNVLIYDSRNCGESGGSNFSFGYYEKYDLDKWIDYVTEKNRGGLIGVHGISMGGATALLHSKINEEFKRVKFYVSDCAYSDLKGVLRDNLRKRITVFESLILFYVNTVTSMKAGFTFKEVSPKKDIGEVTTPIMFIHGEKDELIYPYMCKELYESKKNGLKKIYIVKDAEHAKNLQMNKEEYRKRLYDFLDEINNISNESEGYIINHENYSFKKDCSFFIFLYINLRKWTSYKQDIVWRLIINEIREKYIC